jgi:6,7-dimethyl-8-ribityllumazine synthase
VTQGITQLNLEYNIPFIFGVLTTNTQQQAIDRASGKHGNKGDEAAVTAIKMASLQREIEK